MPKEGQHREERRDVFARNVAIEGELRSREYQREVVVRDQKTAIWEIRVDSVFTLDRAAKRESTAEGDQEVPRLGAFPRAMAKTPPTQAFARR